MFWEFTERALNIAWGIKGQWQKITTSQYTVCRIVIQLCVTSINHFLQFSLLLFPTVLSTKLLIELWLRIRNCRCLSHDPLTTSVHAGQTSNCQYSHLLGFWSFLIHHFCKLDTPQSWCPWSAALNHEQMEIFISPAPRPSGEMILNQMFYIACQTWVPHRISLSSTPPWLGG